VLDVFEPVVGPTRLRAITERTIPAFVKGLRERRRPGGRVGDRPDRYEPRRRKRRPKPSDRLMKPRHEAKRAVRKGDREK
jgi:hypothetical protein